MTRDEAVDAWTRGVPVVNEDAANGDVLYLRISALIWRMSSTEELNRGLPEKYLQVELESMNGANSRTVTNPSALRLPTPEELASPSMYPPRPEAYRKPKPGAYATPEARKRIQTAEDRPFDFG